MWTAEYLPMTSRDNPTKDGFATEAEAWEYVFSQMCPGCREERKAALAGEKAPPDSDLEYSEYPACSCEWIVAETEKLAKCENFGDVLEAGGFKKVWDKNATANASDAQRPVGNGEGVQAEAQPNQDQADSH